jgi:dolichol-phosphate mannosyltransferase
MKTLIFVPTYNEKDNAPRLCDELMALELDADLLFLDDNSPDGTGKLLDDISAKNPRLNVIHRSGKLGIGSAHYDGIKWAYKNGYQTLITMDADYTHRPDDVARLFSFAHKSDVVIASRHLSANSLPGWNWIRKLLTKAGHLLTKSLLGMSYDATGALRLYRLDKIPQEAFELVHSKGYSFFFESLFILFRNNFKIIEIPIELPARTYGSSKMDFKEVLRSVSLLFKTFFTNLISSDRYQIVKPLSEYQIDRKHYDPQGWDDYWLAKKTGWSFVYDIIAVLYRKILIRPSLNHFITKTYPAGAKLLHAGSGGGQVDVDIRKHANIMPLDISVNALNWYRRVNGGCDVIHGSIFEIPVADASFDGVYNLGVMEHFTEDEIVRIFKEFARVIRPKGKIVIFWPPEFGLSVNFFKILKVFASIFMGKKDAKFHPDEITRARSREHVADLLRQGGFAIEEYYFGARDMFTQVMLVASKVDPLSADSKLTNPKQAA